MSKRTRRMIRKFTRNIVKMIVMGLVFEMFFVVPPLLVKGSISIFQAVLIYGINTYLIYKGDAYAFPKKKR